MQFIDIDRERIARLITTSPRHRALRKSTLRHISDLDTQVLPAITTRPMLPLDFAGRPYLWVVNPTADTLHLVEVLVNRYKQVQGCNPTVVCLSAFRYITFWVVWKHYYPDAGDPIPYAYESGGYDVMVRGGR